MKCRVFWLFLAFTLVLTSRLHAAAWTKLVEELAERATAVEGGSVERTLILHEGEEASGLVTGRLTNSADESALLRRFERLQGVDDVLRYDFKALSPAERRVALELGEGAQRVLKLYPGREGTRILQHLDAAGLAQSRTYGDFVVDGMAWLESDEAILALRESVLKEAAPAVMQTLGLKSIPAELSDSDVAALWKSVVRKTGDGAGEFWKRYIAPHKGKWLAGGLLVTYLAMPEKFHDALGNLTEYATRELAKLGISVTVGAGRGLIAGVGDGVARQFAVDPTRTVLALAVAIFLLLLAIPRFRWLWRRGLRRLFAVPSSTADSSPASVSEKPGASPKTVLPTHAPLHE